MAHSRFILRRYDPEMRSFSQSDVFTNQATRGNPVAVVLDAEAMTDDEMARFANWTNLSETTFVLPPTDPQADYRVRIFTPGNELPFAGHPTIGTCHAWLEAGGQPQTPGTVIQECGVGLVTLRQTGRLAFAAPPLIKGGPVSEDDVAPVCAVLGIERAAIIDAQWCDNGPGWLAVMLESADAVLALEPDFSQTEGIGAGVIGEAPLGVVGPNKIGTVGMSGGSPDSDASSSTSGSVGMSGGSPDSDIEVRAFFRTGPIVAEDPVTGSLNAAVAQWLLGNGTLTAPYVARQGTALGREGYVYVEEADGEIWIGGDAVTVIAGTVDL